MDNQFVYDIVSDRLIDFSVESELQIKTYIENKDIVFLENFFYINYHNRIYIPKTYHHYKKLLNIFNLLKNRKDINIKWNKKTSDFFSIVRLEENTDAHIFQYWCSIEGVKELNVFKFKISIYEGIVYFIYPLIMDIRQNNMFEDSDEIAYISSPNVYNLICGLLNEKKIVYTYVDRLGTISTDDIYIQEKTEEMLKQTIEITKDSVYYQKKLELFMNEHAASLSQEIQKNYFNFNLLLNYFLSKNIYINLFLQDIEDIYEKVIDVIDQNDDLEIEENMLDKLEELLILKNKIESYNKIEEIYTTTKTQLTTEQQYTALEMEDIFIKTTQKLKALIETYYKTFNLKKTV